MLIYDTLVNITDSFLGESKRGCSETGQIQYNCPACSANNGDYHGDGKYNLEINFKKGKFQCWACADTNDMYGNIYKLIEQYGNSTILKQYKEEIKNIKNSDLYRIYLDNEDAIQEIEEIALPKGYASLIGKRNDKEYKEVYNYLNERKINDLLIEHYNIGCVITSPDNFRLNNRIIFPSYDKFNKLNFWTGRDYTDTTNNYRQKYENIEGITKIDIMFNEYLINWDADITLVEGPFDHIVVPNSIPLLGKPLKQHYYEYKELIKNAKQNINIFLDNDAYKNVIMNYKLLNVGNLYNRIRYIPCDTKMDPAKIYELEGYRGIARHLRNAQKIHELDLI
jgi:hypothetical protein